MQDICLKDVILGSMKIAKIKCLQKNTSCTEFKLIDSEGNGGLTLDTIHHNAHI